MEDNVFPRPAVAGILSAEYVEARLHTDGETNIERIHELQESLARIKTNPVYVIVDQETEKELGRFLGATLGEGPFVEFLEKPLAAGG